MNALGRIVWITLIGLVAAGSSHAAEIWLDADGDGLPDTDTLAVQVGDPVTVGIWIDSDSYTWTNFLAYVEFTEGLEVDSATYSVTGGGPFPIDDFSRPNTIGLGGSGYSESGVTRIGELYARATASGLICFAPLTVEGGDLFSQLGADTTYALFDTASSACLAATGDGGGDDSEEHDFDVPGQEPSWCHEIAFVKLRDASGSSFMQTASDLRATYGLRILLGIGPDGLICQSLPGVTGDATELANDERVEFVTRDVVPTVDAERMAITASTVGAVDIWNYIKTRTPAVSSEAGETQRMPVNCLPERGQRTGEPGPSGEETLSLEHDAQRQTSVYMLGDVGLKVIFPESQASGGCPTENWTSGQITQVLGETAEALLFYSSYPMESLVSFFMPEPYSVTNTATEPITGNHDANQWREEAMQQLGFGSGDHTEREFAFCNSKRQAFWTDWYYLAYVVNSACDANGLFADGYFAFVDDLHTPAVIMTYDNDNWGIGYLDMVMRHETGHVFGSADEYDADRCECGNLFGYLHVGNGNCVSCTADQDPCIMADASLQFSGVMCPFTLGQVGWRDTDGDGPFDPIDPNSGRDLLVGDTGDIVSPGDIIDIYTQSLDWVKRLAASERAEDGGGLVWDGLNYAGYVGAAPAIYLWQKNNGGSSYAAPLRLEVISKPDFAV